jgi:putative heme-binding domain-containing protein
MDKKGEDSAATLHDLAPILVQFSGAELQAKSSELERMARQGQLSLTRQIAWAARVTEEPQRDKLWDEAQSNPAQLESLLLGLPLVPQDSMRAPFYSKIKPLLQRKTEPALVRATAAAMVAVPGHETETFNALATLVQDGIEIDSIVASLSRIPSVKWPADSLGPLAQSLLEHLRAIPPAQRAEPTFAPLLQFETEVASRLPPEVERKLTVELRNIGPRIITLHAVYEQMRFDQDRLVVEAGKPVLIILQNDDAMPHNLAVLAPGALQEVGLAAEKMSPEPDAEGRLYVPPLPKVLHATKLVGPGQKLQLAFNAPSVPENYPFVCTFPGHWLRMSGNLVVVPDLEWFLASHPLSQQPNLTDWKLTDFAADLSLNEGRNLASGRELFSKLACIQCHKLGPQGYTYGPDLTEVFLRYKNDAAAVLQQILEPSKVIEDRYRNFNFELKADDSVIGMILKEDDQTVTIQTGPANSLIQVLNKKEIQKRHAQPSSPMPVGLLNSLSKTEVLDLLAYLKSGGKVLNHVHGQVSEP